MIRGRVATAFVIALGCILGLVGGLLLAGSAGAARDPIDVSVDGGPFVARTERALLDVDGMAPGGSTSAIVGVRSGVASDATLSLRMHDVHDDDGGCGRTERRVDRTCGPGDGELGTVLMVRVDGAETRHGRYSTRWLGTVDQLRAGIDTAVDLPSDATRWLRVTASIPASTGNEIESDTFRFALTVGLHLHPHSSGSGQGGEAGGHGGGTSEIGGSSGGPLGGTGVPVVTLLGVAAVAVGIGMLLVGVAGRHRRTKRR